jgi:hypothetical protein
MKRNFNKYSVHFRHFRHFRGIFRGQSANSDNSAKFKLKIMNEFRYILEPYKGMNTRYHCPVCQQKDRTFVRYIDTETGEHLSPIVGRCNRR